MHDPATRIPLSDCVPGGIYRLHSRNLAFGVFDGEAGFVGIREKFSFRSLFTEYHYDMGAAGYGTVSPVEKVGQIPEGMHPGEMLLWCKTCGEPLDFDISRGETVEERYQHIDRSITHAVDLERATNNALFPLLEEHEARLAEERLAAGQLDWGMERKQFILLTAEERARRVSDPDSSVSYEDPDAGREVDAQAYFAAQRAAGQAIGFHHFKAADGSGGRVRQRRV